MMVASELNRVAHRGWVVPIVLAVLFVGIGLGVGGVVANRASNTTRGSVLTPSVTATAVSRSAVYPREVLASNIRDSPLRDAAMAISPMTVFVELAPGVYANPPAGPLGRIEDYTFVFGRCADINRYSQSHQVARACW
jgi:hypothetical protein